MTGNFDVVNELLKDPQIDNNKLFHVASRNGKFEELVKLLLKDPRIDPSANNNLAIHIAFRNGNFNIVELLLQDPRIDLSSSEYTFEIDLASINGNSALVQFLVATRKRKIQERLKKRFQKKEKFTGFNIKDLL